MTKLHIEQVCKAHKEDEGRKNTLVPAVSALRGRSSAPLPAIPTPLDAVASIFYFGAY